MDREDYLTFYSKVFDVVEIDLSNSTDSDSYSNKLHNDRLLFKKWVTDTPHNFRFTIKLPRYIIEDAYKVGDFLKELAPLKQKVLAVIIESRKWWERMA